MESNSSMKDLDPRILQNMSVYDLEIKIHDSIHANVPRSEIFDALMTWLNEQIKQDIITQTEEIIHHFVRVLHMRNYARFSAFTLQQVDEVFMRWLEHDAIDNPAYTRRYLITQQDVHRLFAHERQYAWDPDSKPKEDHLPVLSSRKKGKKTRVKKYDNLLHDLDVNKSENAPQSYTPLAGIETAEIEVSQSKGFKHTKVVSARKSSVTFSQCAEAGGSINTRDTIPMDCFPVAEFSPNSTTIASRGRERLVCSESPETFSQLKDYICDRCNKPGHLIQYCPTNLDPRYDQEPVSEYRCKHCGQHGNHIAALCPKNPSETSLAKQRERAAMTTRGPQTPNKTDGRRYLCKEASTGRCQERYRSRSPQKPYRVEYRSRSPDHYRPRRTGTDCNSRQTLDEDKRIESRFSDSSDVSPYTARVRPTRKFPASPESREKGECPSRSKDNSFRSERRDDMPSSSCCTRSPFPERAHKWSVDLGQMTRRNDEGRLAYDDEVDVHVGARSSPSYSTTTNSSQCTILIGGDGKKEATLLLSKVSSDESNKIREEAEEFLSALAADIMSKGGEGQGIPQSVVLNTHDTKMGTDYNPHWVIENDGNHEFEIATESKLSVTCPPFSPEIVSLFKARENPIVNFRLNRKTASEMMKESNGF
ncbi:hypothetical protein F5B22DRAFT_588550 [Xylaria bambusicola]|uniref:uncharacterized protein n=1 Tax=Xylaria bambusicola TaxID=326684 RepID=UPI002008D0E9|nr:uncharacterized protein F5B22DRAFT_588550 [Xylaria bambusicola]KAI0525981.1 hypothetical protein F5B22DRAFT_588550 [Xylaria bambusicola]